MKDAVYDNFIRRHGNKPDDCDGAKNASGVTIREDVRAGIKANRKDAKKTPLGGPHYAAMRQRHPKQAAGVYPEAPEGMLPTPDIARLTSLAVAGMSRRRQEWQTINSFLLSVFLIFVYFIKRSSWICCARLTSRHST